MTSFNGCSDGRCHPSVTSPCVSSRELTGCTGLLMKIRKWRLREFVGLVAALHAGIEQRSERL